MFKKFILLISISIFFSSPSFSSNHNSLEVDLERVKKDIIDLQKFVYKNEKTSANKDNLSSDTDTIKQQLLSINEKLISLEKQMIDMKDDISNLYQLYTSPQFQSEIIFDQSNNLNIDESSTKIVSEKSNDQILGQMALSDLEKETINDKTNDSIEKDIENKKTLGELSISSLEEQKISQNEPTEEQLATLKDLDILMKSKDLELNKPVINVYDQMQMAKQSLASLENQSAIDSLLLIIDSEKVDKEILAETYYLLGRTYFIEGQVIESVKFFGLRHRDLSEIDKFRTENYFWLGKSLFGIGDQENGCLIMEDLIFSDLYLENIEIIDNAKNLQLEKDCGLIID